MGKETVFYYPVFELKHLRPFLHVEKKVLKKNEWIPLWLKLAKEVKENLESRGITAVHNEAIQICAMKGLTLYQGQAPLNISDVFDCFKMDAMIEEFKNAH